MDHAKETHKVKQKRRKRESLRAPASLASPLVIRFAREAGFSLRECEPSLVCVFLMI